VKSVFLQHDSEDQTSVGSSAGFLQTQHDLYRGNQIQLCMHACTMTVYLAELWLSLSC